MRYRPTPIVFLIATLAAAPLSAAEPKTEAKPAAEEPPVEELIRADFEAKQIDLEAVVVQRQAEWLELIACSPQSREHESLVTVAAPPSAIHAALLAMGLTPGQPAGASEVEGQVVSRPPQGDPVSVHFVVNPGTEHEREVPASRWVIEGEAGEPMPEQPWRFAGSQFVPRSEFLASPAVRQDDEPIDPDDEVYLADLNGTVVSLVNFGDDLLARDTTVTRANDAQQWRPNTAVIPGVGTRVLLRLRPAAAEESGADSTPDNATD